VQGLHQGGSGRVRVSWHGQTLTPRPASLDVFPMAGVENAATVRFAPLILQGIPDVRPGGTYPAMGDTVDDCRWAVRA
jgi:hypothetical protein